MTNDTETHVYLYGIVASEAHLPGLAGIDALYKLYGLVEDGLQAAISQVRPELFATDSDKAKVSEALTRLVMTHESIVSTVLEKCTVLPAGFATVLRDEAVTRDLLRSHEQEWKEMLLHLNNCVEVSVCARIDEAALAKELYLESASVALTGANYLRRRKNDLDGKAKLLEHVDKLLTELHESCAEVSRDHQIKPVDPNILDEMGHTVYMRAYYLVERHRITDLKRIVREYSNLSWLHLSVDGPFAPYHFSSRL